MRRFAEQGRGGQPVAAGAEAPLGPGVEHDRLEAGGVDLVVPADRGRGVGRGQAEAGPELLAGRALLAVPGGQCLQQPPARPVGGELAGLVAPALEDRVGGEGVLDQAPAQGPAVDVLVPAPVQVPVVGDVVVVEDHVGGDVGQGPPHPGQGAGELEHGRAAPVGLGGRQGGGAGRVARPQRVRPDQQVHAVELGQRHQVAVQHRAGEAGPVAHQVVAVAGGQPRVAGGDVGEGLGRRPAEGGPADLLAEGQQPGGDVVGVDLVAGQEQQLGPGLRVGVAGRQDVVEGGQGVAALAVRLAAGPVHEPDLLQAFRREDEAGQVPRPVAELAEQPQRPQVGLGRAVVAGVAGLAAEPEVVAVDDARGQGGRRPGRDHGDVQRRPQGHGPGLGGAGQALRVGQGPLVDREADRPGARAGHEHADRLRLDPARHRPGQHQRPGGRRRGGHGDGSRGSAGTGPGTGAGAVRRCCRQRQPR